MSSLAIRKDYLIVSTVGLVFGGFLIPILENIKPAFWALNFQNAAILILGFLFFANFALWIGSIVGHYYFPLWQFVKFGAVGSMNAAIDLGLINLLSFIFTIYSGYWLAVFNIISLSVAMINSYLLNRFWSFSSATPIKGGEATKFIFVSLTTLLINTALVYVLTTLVGVPENFTPASWENIAKLIGVPVTLILNFLGYKLIVFKT